MPDESKDKETGKPQGAAIQNPGVPGEDGQIGQPEAKGNEQDVKQKAAQEAPEKQENEQKGRRDLNDNTQYRRRY